jgi:hypothetical protein
VIEIRTGDARGYDVVRGVRVECGDGESYDGCSILVWDCPIAEARAYAAEHGLSVDWAAMWDSQIPSLDGCVEAPVVGEVRA